MHYEVRYANFKEFYEFFLILRILFTPSHSPLQKKSPANNYGRLNLNTNYLAAAFRSNAFAEARFGNAAHAAMSKYALSMSFPSL